VRQQSARPTWRISTARPGAVAAPSILQST